MANVSWLSRMIPDGADAAGSTPPAACLNFWVESLKAERYRSFSVQPPPSWGRSLPPGVPDPASSVALQDSALGVSLFSSTALTALQTDPTLRLTLSQFFHNIYCCAASEMTWNAHPLLARSTADRHLPPPGARLQSPRARVAEGAAEGGSPARLRRAREPQGAQSLPAARRRSTP